MVRRLQIVLHTAANLSRKTLMTSAELNRHLIHGGLDLQPQRPKVNQKRRNNMMKYHVTIRATTDEGRKQRTFTVESDKESEVLQKQIEQEYDMLRNVQVIIKLL